MVLPNTMTNIAHFPVIIGIIGWERRPTHFISTPQEADKSALGTGALWETRERHYQTSTTLRSKRSTEYSRISHYCTKRAANVLSRSEEAATRSFPPWIPTPGHALLKPAIPPMGLCWDQRALIGWELADWATDSGKEKGNKARKEPFRV